MKYIHKLICSAVRCFHLTVSFLFILIFLFANIKAQTYSNLAEVLSSGGGESTGGNYSNFGVIGETFVDYSVTGGNYSTSIGFIYMDTLDFPDNVIEIFNNKIISIFPNPSDGIINIENKNLKADKIEIFNILGKKVFESRDVETFHETSLRLCIIDISELSNGLYFLKVLDKDGEILKIEKIIKE